MFKKLTLFLFFVIVFIALIFFIFILFPIKHTEIIERYSSEYGLDSNLVFAVINAESGFRSNAVSKKGAKGLMQIMDNTGEWGYHELQKEGIFSADKLFDPDLNIELGCWYLSKLINQYKNTSIALAAYNAGPGNVSRWLADPDIFDGRELNIPYSETKYYVRKVLKYHGIYSTIRNAPDFLVLH